jgi:hypothetical protein
MIMPQIVTAGLRSVVLMGGVMRAGGESVKRRDGTSGRNGLEKMRFSQV